MIYRKELLDLLNEKRGRLADTLELRDMLQFEVNSLHSMEMYLFQWTHYTDHITHLRYQISKIKEQLDILAI